MIKFYLKNLTVLLFVLGAYSARAQSITGKITDSKDNSSLPGVSVTVEGSSAGTTTTAEGTYSLKLSPGTYTLKVSYIGYTTQTRQVQVGDAAVQANFSMVASGTQLADVVIIGSRSTVPRTNIETAVPVDLIPAKELKSYGQTDVTQILNFVAPSFSSNRQTVADGTDHIDPASLRGLGPDQALVLVNGKRRHTTALVNINGTFGRGTVGTDLNAIPAAAIERIEVLRDGAAAQYGSDAIAGVINIVLKKNTPLAVSTSYGQSASSAMGRDFYDGKTFQLDISKGFDLNKKGFISFAGQYLSRGATNRGGLDTRPLLYTGLPTKGANESEADFQTRYAGLQAADNSRAQQNGLSRNNMIVGNSDAKNGGGFVNGQYTIAKNVDVYLAGGYTYREGKAAGFYRLPSQTTQTDNSIYPNGFLPFINTSITDASASGGIKGLLGKWDFDLSHTFGRNSIGLDITNTLNASLPVGTSPTRFYAGKLAFNQNTTDLDFNRKFNFDGALTSLNTALGAEYRVDNYQIEPGEELSYSFGQPSAGIPGRTIGSSFTAAGAQVFPGYKPANAIDKSRNNKGVYADLEAEFGPKLLLGAAGRYEHYSDFGSNFSYKFTGRYKVYKDFAIRGAISTGFRAPSLHQRYFNNESTQFVAGQPTQVLTVNNDNNVVRQFGVGSLKAETSQSYSLGLTGKLLEGMTFTIDAYQINIDNRIVFSSQYTRERNAAGALIPTGLVNQILNTVDPNAQINSVQFFTNAISTKTKGLDIVLNKPFTIGTKGDRLVLTAAANFNKTNVASIQGSETIENNPTLKARLFDRLERSRYESSVPRNKFNFSAAYSANKWGVSARTVRFGEVTYLNAVDPTIASNNLPLQMDQTFSPKWVTDLTINYKFTKQLDFAIGANNIFDVYPDALYIDPRNASNNLSGISTTNYTGNRDNSSNGRFLYSRAVTQFGFNGRYLFGRLTFTM